MNKTGKKVNKCGLFVALECPHLAATPDGVVENEDAIIEVKCPYVGKREKIEPNPKFFPFLEAADGGGLKLKTTHNYYFQVQGQLNICNKQFCYFIVYTFKDCRILRITRDPTFYDAEMVPKLYTFFKKHFLPCVVENLASKPKGCKCPK